MKKITIGCTALLMLMGCHIDLKKMMKPKTHIASVIDDRTDNFRKRPGEEIIQGYGFNDKDIYDLYMFRYQSIGEVSLADIRSLTLKSEFWLFANKYSRIEDVELFRDSVREILRGASRGSQGTKEKSSCFRTIINECNYLAKISDSAIIYIYSDVSDHNSLLDSYSPVMQDLMANSADQVQASLEKVMKIERLDHLRVYIVFQSANASDEARVLICSNFYRKFLSSHGATVEVVPAVTFN